MLERSLQKERRKSLSSGDQKAITLPPRKAPHTSKMIVAFLGASVKEYQANYLQFLAKLTLTCPLCGGKCHHHAWYNRKACDGIETFTITILRVKCITCPKTHAVLPDFLRPYSRYVQQVREPTVIACHVIGVPTEKATIHGQALETTRRWVTRFKKGLATIVSALTNVVAGFGRYQPATRGSPFCRMIRLCREFAESLDDTPPMFSTFFGLVNSFLSLGGMRVWL